MANTNRAEREENLFKFDSIDDLQNGKSGYLSKADTAAYISDVVLQLRNMAKRADMKFLVYFLEMAFQEAFTQSTRLESESSKKVEK